MKKLLLFSFSLLVISLASARTLPLQNMISGFKIGNDTIELYDTLGNKINNGVIKITSTNPLVDVITGHIWLKNTTTTLMPKVYVHRTINQEVSGTENYFCFGKNCYGSGTDQSPNPDTIQIGGVLNKSFYGDYSPYGHAGMTSVTYEFFDSTTFGKRVSAKTTVEFKLSAAGISDDKLLLKGPNPNPSSQYATFEYNLPAGYSVAHLIIRNMLGVEVDNITLDNRSGKKAINVSNYSSGIYFYTFIVDNKIVQSKKMIVKH